MTPENENDMPRGYARPAWSTPLTNSSTKPENALCCRIDNAKEQELTHNLKMIALNVLPFGRGSPCELKL